jgi:type I restriction enzyme S subunit
MAVGPFGSRMKADLYVSSGVRVIRGNNLSGGREPEGNYVFVSEKTADSLASCCLRPGDIVFPHRGNIGEVGITPDDGRRYMLSTSLMKLSPDRARANPLFLMYFFKSSAGRAALLVNASQVGTPGIATPLKSLRGIQLSLPPLPVQNEIAATLSRLDDRITLLRETNATLEAIAQALFKSWFVDFDPVRAKQEGRAPEGMDEATAALFPDGFEESELGLVPMGWRYVSLRDVVEIFDSRRIPLSGQDRAKRRGPYPYFGAAALMDSIDDFIFDGIYLLIGEDGSVADEQGYPITQYVSAS